MEQQKENDNFKTSKEFVEFNINHFKSFMNFPIISLNNLVWLAVFFLIWSNLNYPEFNIHYFNLEFLSSYLNQIACAIAINMFSLSLGFLGTWIFHVGLPILYLKLDGERIYMRLIGK